MNETSTSVAFELRANVAIRILVERIDLEPGPHLTIDADSARRRTWQSIAHGAVAALLPDAGAAVPAVRQKRKRRQKRQQEVHAHDHTHTCVHCHRGFTPLPQHAKRARACPRTECQKKRARASALLLKAARGGEA